ncbi:MAG: hypothetical protein ABIH41_00375 [Nanoarchaeota archaeon]
MAERFHLDVDHQTFCSDDVQANLMRVVDAQVPQHYALFSLAEYIFAADYGRDEIPADVLCAIEGDLERCIYADQGTAAFDGILEDPHPRMRVDVYDARLLMPFLEVGLQQAGLTREPPRTWYAPTRTALAEARIGTMQFY